MFLRLRESAPASSRAAPARRSARLLGSGSGTFGSGSGRGRAGSALGLSSAARVGSTLGSGSTQSQTRHGRPARQCCVDLGQRRACVRADAVTGRRRSLEDETNGAFALKGREVKEACLSLELS